MTTANEIDSIHDILENARGVMQNPAFAHWRKMVEEQAQGRQAQMLQPAGNMDKLVEQEYMKGEVVGMLQAVRMWELMLELLQADIQRKQQETDQ